MRNKIDKNMDAKEIKRLGNRIYSLGQKIEESSKNGMTTRIPGYVEQLEKESAKLAESLPKIKEEYVQ